MLARGFGNWAAHRCARTHVGSSSHVGSLSRVTSLKHVGMEFKWDMSNMYVFSCNRRLRKPSCYSLCANSFRIHELYRLHDVAPMSHVSMTLIWVLLIWFCWYGTHQSHVQHTWVTGMPSPWVKSIAHESGRYGTYTRLVFFISNTLEWTSGSRLPSACNSGLNSLLSRTPRCRSSSIFVPYVNICVCVCTCVLCVYMILNK